MTQASPNKTHGFAQINGMEMYYEIEGSGEPLVYVHPILSHAGLSRFPELAADRRVISMDLRGHGRTVDTADQPLSIEQFARDVVGLLAQLGIHKADFLGESYGAAVVTMIAVKHSDLVRRVATYGGAFGSPDEAHNLEMLRFDAPPTADSASHSFQRDAYLRVAAQPQHWPLLWDKIMQIHWNGFSDEELAAIKAPILLGVGDHDFIRVEHTLQTFRKIVGAELAVIPDAGHFLLFSESQRFTPVVRHFLTKADSRLPIGTGGAGYQPGRTR